MGANLCCLKPSSPKQKPKVISSSVSSTIELNEPSCSLKREEMVVLKSPPEKKMAVEVKHSTLKDMLLTSPGRPAQCISESDLMIKQLPKQIFLASPELRTEFFTPRNCFSSPRDGFSSAKLGKVDEKEEEEEEDEDEDEFLVSSSSIIESGNKSKRVTFRSPEEADIWIFEYSPGEMCEDY